MTREEEAKKELSKLIFELGFEDNIDDKVYALNMAIQALYQISDIKAIINNPMYIQEDVLRYQMICEVVKE
ncbi:MAG: hypothetical protein IKL53_07565 [Lachnospiraceae bacterium]|nr:hypothetical protein [Lachnospiraceae bacterium]